MGKNAVVFGATSGIGMELAKRNRHVPAYHASKAFQSNYMESLWMKARRTKKAKIYITNILPGYVDTEASCYYDEDSSTSDFS